MLDRILHSNILWPCRDSPFNLKGGGGAMVFWRTFLLSANLMEKKILSLTWAGKNLLKALYAYKKLIFVEKINKAQKKSRCPKKL